MPRGIRGKASEIFRGVLQDAATQLALTSQGAEKFVNRGIRGDERAAALSDFFKRHLPSDFDVRKGEAIDFSDTRTGQLDLVIYDHASSAPILAGSENVLLPCEALYVVVEVKSVLSQDELNMAYAAAARVRALRPFKKHFVGRRTDGAYADDNAFRCMYVVFAYQSNLGQTDWLAKEFSRAKAAATAASTTMDVVDRIVVLDRGIIHPSRSIGKESADDHEDVFLTFYLNVVNFVAREHRRRPPVDWQVYAEHGGDGWEKLA